MKHAKIMAPVAAIATALLLSACAGPTQTTLSDGTVAYRIGCESTPTGLNYCFERAGKSCGAEGYTIVDADGRILSKSDVAEADADARVREYARDQAGILIKCGI